MNQLIRHTEYLISRSDCVIIPGLGALLANYCSATIDPCGIAHAPRRKFTFNPEICDNDGTLAHSISRSLDIPIAKANEYIKREVEAMRHQLHTQGEISIGKVGTLAYNRENSTIEFLPYEIDRISIATSWLPDVNFSPIASAEARTPLILQPVRKRSFSRYISRAAAAVAIVFGVWFFATNSFKTTDDIMGASLAPELNLSTASQTDNNVDAVSETAADAADNCVDDCEAEDIDIAQLAADDNTSLIDSEMCADKLYIIVGATISTDEALKFIDMHPGNNLRVAPYGRKYVVYSSTHTSESEAEAACLEARNTFEAAWIANKK